MTEAEIPRNEPNRLEALHCLSILDSVPEQRFDHIVTMACELFDVPVALISLVDSERQWFKARSGLTQSETPRSISFCSHAVSHDKPVIVEDALLDERFRDNPLVTGDMGVRFYAGHPIHSPDGYVLGTLCVIDRSPRKFDEKNLSLLKFLAELVDKEIASDIVEDSAPPHSPNEQFGAVFQTLGGFMSRRPVAVVLAIGIFLTLLVTSSRQYVHSLENEHLEEQAAIAGRLFNLRGRLETELNARLHLTHGLAGLVRAGPENIDRGAFLSFAQDLGSSLTGIRSLQLAPNGVVQFLWPEQTNSPALGHDLLADPNRRQAAKHAIDRRELWVAGPLELIQGGTALIGRLPVFLPTDDPDRNDGAENFWGFATVLVDLDSLVRITEFERYSSELTIAIRGRNGLGSDGEVFLGPDSVFDGKHLSASVSLPGGSWEIGIAIPPTPTLSNISSTTWALFVAVCFLISTLLYVLIRLPFRYVQAVETAKKALAKSNARFTDAIESLPDGFAIFDEGDRLIRCNHRYREFFTNENQSIPLGLSFEELLLDGIDSGLYRFPDSDASAREKFHSMRISHHHNPTAEGIELELTNGRWLRAVESRVPSGGTVIAYSDVSELKRKEHELAAAKQRAESANEAKSTFLATVSHELRTPLNAILGLVNLLQTSGRLEKKDQEYVDITHESAEHLLNLLNELLDLSKMESNKLELECNQFDLSAVARKTLKLCANKAQHKNITLVDRIESSAEVIVEGDAGRLQQILLNLLSNGIKFTDKGSVTLALQKKESSVGKPRFSFTVQDTGVGFTDDQAGMLFQPFHQLDSTASRKHEGTGLGLAICKRLVRLMGGDISANGEPGKGATFEFEIPLSIVKTVTEQQTPELGEDETLRNSSRSPIRVLIAEDSPANQIVFRAMLEDTGYVVDIVGNGLEAVRAVEDFEYDVILMDIFMPEMDGIEATRVIRQSKAMDSKPIIALTANAMPGDQERFLEAGMDDYLAKPVNKSRLLQMLDRWTIGQTQA